jgi:ATP-dependent exoDNAse (exonuclease V) beta subunit
MPAVYPPVAQRRDPQPAVGCPSFASKDSVLNRPDGDPAKSTTVAPGQYAFGINDARSGIDDRYSVVWWDPHALALEAPSGYGLRRDDLISKDGDPDAVAARLQAYRTWQTEKADAIAEARRPSIVARIATDMAAHADQTPGGAAIDISVIDLARSAGRPYGPRFGTLVHATLATVPLDADEAAIRAVARTQARILLAPDEEADGAAEVVNAALRHELFARIRECDAGKRCDRELPIIWSAADGALIEGTVDLVFEEDGALTVLDFKTDRELDQDRSRYERQLTIYCRALAAMRNKPARGILMRV